MPTPLVKRTVNGVIGLLRELPALPSESELSTRLGVSRSPVRAALAILARRGVLRRQRGTTVLARKPRAGDGFPDGDGHATRGDAFEAFFLRKLESGALKPGT